MGYAPPNRVTVEFRDAAGELIERLDVDVASGVAQLRDPLPAGTTRVTFAGSIRWPRPLTVLDVNGERIPWQHTGRS